MFGWTNSPLYLYVHGWGGHWANVPWTTWLIGNWQRSEHAAFFRWVCLRDEKPSDEWFWVEPFFMEDYNETSERIDVTFRLLTSPSRSVEVRT